MAENNAQTKQLGLILPGGGARAAYQVGVLKGINALLERPTENPFPVLCGTSAGAINALALASKAGDFNRACHWMEGLWLDLHTDQVYRSDTLGVIRNALRLFGSLFNQGQALGKPVALLDNTPLREFLGQRVDFAAIAEHIQAGNLGAVSIAAMDYTEGHSVNFFQGGPDAAGWSRWRRHGVASPIQLQHLMASSAIPTLFPPERIGRHYYGDGALRQLTPISPALHLGASKVLIIPANGHRKQYARTPRPIRSPAFGEIIGHLLSSAFVDTIENDIERLERINELVQELPEGAGNENIRKLRPIDAMVISPSEDIDQIAEQHAADLPGSVRRFVRRTGSNRNNGGVNLASYLLFTPAFTRELIALGQRDALNAGDQLKQFLASGPVSEKHVDSV